MEFIKMVSILDNLQENREQNDELKKILHYVEVHLQEQDNHLASQDRVLENLTKQEEKMEYEEKVCDFKKYAKQTLDLLVDSFKWKTMAEECDDADMKNKYMTLSNTLFDMFMKEHEAIVRMFKGE